MLIPWYVTGYCEAAGVFTYSRSGNTYTLYFSIKQTESHNQTLKDIQQFFGYVGKIYGQGTSSVFRVNKIDELQRITEHFDKYPLQNKKRSAAYALWRQMVIYKLENYRVIDYTTLKAMADQLSSLN